MSFLKFNTKLFKYKSHYIYIYLNGFFYNTSNSGFLISAEMDMHGVHFVDINKKTLKRCAAIGSYMPVSIQINAAIDYLNSVNYRFKHE